MTLSRERLGLALLGVLIALVLIDVPWLGVDAWAFVAPKAVTGGVLGPLVRAAGGHWDLGIVRAPALLAGLLVFLRASKKLQLSRLPDLLAVAIGGLYGIALAFLLPKAD